MGRWRPPSPGSSPYITAAGYRALETELHRLGERRAETVRHLAAAAAEGDRSENAEYLYRKKELREIDRRLGYLQRRMPALTVVAQAPPVRDRVYFGALVELEDAAGRCVQYRIVGADELGRAAHFISIDSPLARALLKRAPDDEVTVQTARGEHRYLVVAIDYPTEDA